MPEVKRGRIAGWAAFAFVGSGCLLVLEIVAGRLLAPTLGVSLYTWTSVIGVVLAGVSLGNYLGGWIADRWPSRSALALVYATSSLASLAILVFVRYVESLQLPSGAPAIVQVLWLTTVLFFIPPTCMAAATPILTRLSLTRSPRMDVSSVASKPRRRSAASPARSSRASS